MDGVSLIQFIILIMIIIPTTTAILILMTAIITITIIITCTTVMDMAITIMTGDTVGITETGIIILRIDKSPILRVHEIQFWRGVNESFSTFISTSGDFDGVYILFLKQKRGRFGVIHLAFYFQGNQMSACDID